MINCRLRECFRLPFELRMTPALDDAPSDKAPAKQEAEGQVP